MINTIYVYHYNQIDNTELTQQVDGLRQVAFAQGAANSIHTCM